MSDNDQRISFCVCYLHTDRLDRLISVVLNQSRTYAKQLILDGCVMVGDDVITKPSFDVGYQALVQVVIPVESSDHQPLLTVQHDFGTQLVGGGYTIPIIFEDHDILVIDKPVGLIVHSGASVSGHTLVDILLAAGISLPDDLNGLHRPGIVHRLDQYTQGLMVVAKTRVAMDALVAQFRDRLVLKQYYAVIVGVLVDDEGEISLPIGRDTHVRSRQSCHHYVEGTQKDAVTQYRVLHRLTNLTVVDVTLITGRTHQIRVHFCIKVNACIWRLFI